MTTKALSAILLILILSQSNVCSAQKSVNIERGRIEDSWSMKIVSEVSKHGKQVVPFEKEIKPNEFFNLAELGLKENPPRQWEAHPVDANGYNNQRISLYYNVEIINPSNGRKYYGKIVFFL